MSLEIHGTPTQERPGIFSSLNRLEPYGLYLRPLLNLNGAPPGIPYRAPNVRSFVFLCEKKQKYGSRSQGVLKESLKIRLQYVVLPHHSSKMRSRLAVIGVPNKFVADWLRERYQIQIKKSFETF